MGPRAWAVGTVFLALALLTGPALVQGLTQVQAIFQFQGPCYPVADGQVAEIVDQVLNPLTGVPWGNAVQSGGFQTLCTKLAGTADCNQAPTVNLAPSPPPPPPPIARSPPPPPVFQSIKNTNNPYGRRLLQSTQCPPASKWYLYLDSSNPNDPQAVAETLKGAIVNGGFLTLLDGTSVTASSVKLLFLTVVNKPDPPPPPPLELDLQVVLQLGGASFPLNGVALNVTTALVEEYVGVPWTRRLQRATLADLRPVVTSAPSNYTFTAPSWAGPFLFLQGQTDETALDEATTALGLLPDNADFVDALRQAAGLKVSNVTVVYVGTAQLGPVELS